MKKSLYTSSLYLSLSILLAPAADAQALKAENAHVQDKFIASNRSNLLQKDGSLPTRQREASRATSSGL
jgi:hypothetical protein